jgi:LysM repeat protein
MATSHGSPRRGAGVLRALATALFLFGHLACGPGFFASEVRAPQSVPIEVEPDIVSMPVSDLGEGCSPKGCLRTPPPAPRPTAVSPRPGTVARARPRQAPVRHPLRDKGKSEIDRLVRSDLEGLGSMSFGTATRGGLLNGVRLGEDPRWTLIDPMNTWGTTETVEYLTAAIATVFEEYPDSHTLFIGDISRKRGGYIKPHISHQSGKDVDISYFYTRNPEWYARANAYNLDRPRTWAFIRALLIQTDVHLIFIDRRVQRLLRSYAEALGEDRDWLDSLFIGAPGQPSIIRHEPGHDTHMHVRFHSPIAEETARRCYPALLEQKKLLPQTYNITHRVKKGETLLGLAKRYGTTVSALLRANGLKQKVIQANKVYFVPQHGPAGPAESRPVPPRRLPPPRNPTGPIAAR